MTTLIKQPDRATEYAEKVASGEVVCGRLHRLACERHLRDLSRMGSPDFPFVWDAERSEKIIDFAETLTILEGYQPRPLVLYGCQCFDLGVPMGWLNRRGYRRFRRKYKSVARQNGKTLENGVSATYLSAFGNYRMGRLVTVANGKKQARLAWEDVSRFILADEDLAEYFRIKDYLSLIEALNTGCIIEALSREGGIQEGFRSIYASLDELHEFRDSRAYDAVYKGQRSLPEALLSMITTRGTDLSSFCYDMDKFCIGVLEGSVTAEDIFADIYTLDPPDSIFDPSCFIKSNPVLCATEAGMEIMQSDAMSAQGMGGTELVTFIVKCQNCWLENSDLQFATADMLALARSKETLEDYRGKPAYVGLDLSHGGALTTMALEFDRDDGGAYTWSHSYMPRGRMEEHKTSDLVPYDLWEQAGLITVTGGHSDFKNDYSFIISELKELLARYDIKLLGIGYDPHNADGFLSQLEAFDCPLLEIRQSARFLSSATEDIQLLMKGGKYSYDEKNELLDWSFRCAKLTFNSFEERKIDKNPHARNKRVDPCDAAVDAHVTRMKLGGKKPVDVNAIMQDYLAKMGWTGKEKKNATE